MSGRVRCPDSVGLLVLFLNQHVLGLLDLCGGLCGGREKLVGRGVLIGQEKGLVGQEDAVSAQDSLVVNH